MQTSVRPATPDCKSRRPPAARAQDSGRGVSGHTRSQVGDAQSRKSGSAGTPSPSYRTVRGCEARAGRRPPWQPRRQARARPQWRVSGNRGGEELWVRRGVGSLLGGACGCDWARRRRAGVVHSDRAAPARASLESSRTSPFACSSNARNLVSANQKNHQILCVSSCSRPTSRGAHVLKPPSETHAGMHACAMTNYLYKACVPSCEPRLHILYTIFLNYSVRQSDWERCSPAVPAVTAAATDQRRRRRAAKAPAAPDTHSPPSVRNVHGPPLSLTRWPVVPSCQHQLL